jgi:hypothetical protein
MTEPRLVHEVIGSQHVYTSPDVPGLYVAHSDQQTALKGVPGSIKMLMSMTERRSRREKLKAVVQAVA